MIVELNPYKSHPYEYFKEDPNDTSEDPYIEEEEDQLITESLEKIEAAPSDWIQFSIYMPTGGNLAPFSFHDRRYLKTIYDSPAKRKLLMAGRQVEKCINIKDLALFSDNVYRKIGDVRVGDILYSVAGSDSLTSGKVSWVSSIILKESVRVVTRCGHELKPAKTHPLLKHGHSWTPAEDLKAGDRVAIVGEDKTFGWDTIVRIEDIGVQECVDFQVDPYHNFVANGFVTHNSTYLGNTILAYAAMNPFFRTLYVSPSNTQTKVFSRDRIKEPMDISPVLKHFANSKLLANVLEKKFVNKSQITLRFAFLNADRCRGIPADYVNIDEFQDILLENIPVIEECASHSDYKMFTYSGTPKSLDNSIEHYWSRFSTQNEWAVPCRRHGTPKSPSSWHWNILDEGNIGDRYLICDRCGGEISARDPDCKWVSLNPNPRVEKPFEGYRLPQLMVPWIEWADIKDKQRKYSRAKFYNEVLGHSYDSGTRPLARRDMQKNCNPDLSMQYYRDVIKWSQSYPVFMGVDWGSGENSYTVVTLGGYLPFDPRHFTYFYMKRFEGIESEPRVQIDQIKQLVSDFNVRYIGVDYGGGFWPNDELVREYGAEKVQRYQWVGQVKKKITFEPRLGVPRFLCHRTEIMSDIFNAIKRGNVFRYPRWEEFEDPYAMDFLNIHSEYSEQLRMNVYKHAAGNPDDTFHSALYAFMASFFYKTRDDIILPQKSIDQDDKEVNLEDLDVCDLPELTL